MGLEYTDISKIQTQDIDVDSIGDKLIMTDIQYIRSNNDKIEGDEEQDAKLSAQQWARLPESYCHAFYRILGLPVINKSLSDFYNPGFYGNEDSDEEKLRRTNIDNAQDDNLLVYERKREQFCYDNGKNFDNVASKLQYRIEMLSFPIPVCLMSKTADAFTPDSSQIIDNYKGRNKFSRVAKILRPFKCVPNITNNIEPITNSLIAPFVSSDTILHTKLTRTYLEFVASIRFKADLVKSTENIYLNTVEDLMNQINMFDLFYDDIKDQNEVESYIFLQMFVSFISICKKVKEGMSKNTQLANELNEILSESTISSTTGEVTINVLNDKINKLKEKINVKKLILSYIPTDVPSEGIQLNNPISCKLTNAFISFVQGDVNQLEKQLNDLQRQNSEQLAKFKSINKNTFYILGEITGIGIFDILALMMSFWILPQEQLLGLFDNASFVRLYNNTQLRNEVVSKRYSNSGHISSISIDKIINNMDKIVLNMLKLADNIISSNITS